MHKTNAGIKTRAKVAKLDRNRSAKIDLLHKWLTRVDIEKDHKELTTRGQIYARQIANAHFGKLDIFEAEYKKACSQVNQTTCTSFGQEYFINTNNIRYNNYTNLQHIKRGFYDAGLSPLEFSDRITILLTPASYLDPASKTWSPEFPEPFGFDMVISKSVFATANIPASSLHSWFNERTGEALFQIDFGFSQLRPLFNSSLSGVNDDALLFFSRGNGKKREWFDDPYALHYKSCSKDQTALLYIACKEMGDLLQAYYAKEYLTKRHYMQRKEVSLFTNDKLMVRRCQLYGVPVVLTTKVKLQNTYTQCYYIVPAMDHVAKDMLAYYRGYIKNTNDTCIRIIKTMIDDGKYKLRNGQYVQVSSELASELHRICSLIHKRTVEFMSHEFDYRYMTLEEFRQISCEYIATDIFDKRQGIFHNMPDSLFVQTRDSELTRLKTIIQTGGGISDVHFDMSIESTDFTNIRWIREDEEGDMLEHYSLQIIVLNIFYNRLKLRYPEKSRDELCFHACDVYAVFRIYFNYIGCTPLQHPLYDECIRMFETRLPTFEEFLKIYAPFQPDLNLLRFSSKEIIWTKLEKANSEKHMRHSLPVLASGLRRRTRKAKRLCT